MSKPSNRIEAFKKRVKGTRSGLPEEASEPSNLEELSSQRGIHDDSLIEGIALNANVGEMKLNLTESSSKKRKKATSDISSSSKKKKKKKQKDYDKDPSDDFELESKKEQKQKRKSLQDITNFIQEKSLLMKKGRSSKLVSNQTNRSNTSTTDENEEPTQDLESVRIEQASSSSQVVEQKRAKEKTTKSSKYKQLLQQELLTQSKKKSYKTQYEQFVTEEVGKISEEIVSSSLKMYGSNQMELLDLSMHDSLNDSYKAVSIVDSLTSQLVERSPIHARSPSAQDIAYDQTKTVLKDNSPLLGLAEDSFTLPKFDKVVSNPSSSNNDDSLNLGDLSGSPFSLRYNVFFKD
ncbi:hypothetical protein C9374_006707 [Naegleria lovaniensis]|uniref:Uncharacterized protein n=1 Tax=Naegleria lovaniensis TaxID=51637 RepID=A0AA88GMQ3_NAELO|nr:uncharacterized protein C9374_006707 [Naegleria lovaniensis]KAG2379590.1 hypothetical protein C9374_006707 [Naegleria lovaniensis]